MKPQLLLSPLETAGYHNGAPKKTKARLEKSASWKRQRIVVILPAGAQVPTKCVLSWWNLIFPPNNGAAKIFAVGCEVGEAYSNAIEQILAHPELSQWEYILTLEHDNAPPPDGVMKLVERMEEHPELDVISGAYYTKGEGGVLQAWGDPKDPILNFRPQLPDPNGGLVECVGTGMGFVLWRLKMFKDKRLRKPWFKTESKEGVVSQDLYFWMDARKYGYRCAIDCSVKVGHYDYAADVMW